MKRTLPILALTIVLVATGAWWWRTEQDRARVAPYLPDLPDLSTVPAAMRDLIVATDARARGHLGPAKGFEHLALVYHANGFLAEASQCYTGLEEIDPMEPRWPHLHASILAGYGQIDPALEKWRKVCKLAPDYLPAHLRLGDCLLKANHPQEATAAYEAALKIEPDNPYAVLGLARLDLEAERWSQARRRLERVVDKTNYALGYDLIVSLYERMGLHQQATNIRGMLKASGAYRDPADPWIDALMDDCRDPYKLSLVAGFIAHDGSPEKALALLQRAAAIAPDDVSVRFQLGTLLVRQRRLDEAQEELERCIQLSPDFADAWAHLSSLHAQQNRATAAERTLAEGLKNCPQSPGLNLMLARSHLQAKRIGEAILAYQKSIQFRPNEADAYIELGNLYISLGREAEGVAQMDQALRAEPGNPVALGVLAYHAVVSGNETGARELIAQARAHPRVGSDQMGRLVAAFRQKFGRAP